VIYSFASKSDDSSDTVRFSLPHISKKSTIFSTFPPACRQFSATFSATE